MKKPRCIRCGVKSRRKGANFCTSCGTRFAAVQKAQQPYPRPSLSSPSFWDRMLYDADPATRETAWNHLHADLLTKSR